MLRSFGKSETVQRLYDQIVLCMMASRMKKLLHDGRPLAQSAAAREFSALHPHVKMPWSIWTCGLIRLMMSPASLPFVTGGCRTGNFMDTAG